MAKLKIGFIGCGGIANAKHFPGMAQQTEYVDMVAFCDLIPERAEKAAKSTAPPMQRSTPTIMSCWLTPPSTLCMF